MKNLLRKYFFSDLEQIEQIGFPIALGLVVYGFFLSVINKEYYDGIYTMRNGFICSLQQLMLFILAIQSGKRAYFFITKKNKVLPFLMFLFFTLLFIFGFGEKVRWGQFIFELPVTEFFQKNNTQGQITIHNLKFGDFSVNKTIFGSFLALVVASYSLLFPFLYRKSNKLALFVGDKLAVPVPKRNQILWYLFIVIIALLIPVPKRGELVQFAGVWSFMMFFSFPKNNEHFK
jgi:hypothetical protein